MTQVKINDAALQKAALEGMDEFVKAFVDAIREAIGGELTAENMAELNSDQITLLAWDTLHEEMMDGGMIQLIHNGYGAFLWKNPTDKAFRNWGLVELSKLIKKSHFLYKSHHEDIEGDMSDEDFMALYENVEDANKHFFLPGEIDLRPEARVRIEDGVFAGLEGYYQKVKGCKNEKGKDEKCFVVKIEGFLSCAAFLTECNYVSLDGKEEKKKKK